MQSPTGLDSSFNGGNAEFMRLKTRHRPPSLAVSVVLLQRQTYARERKLPSIPSKVIFSNNSQFINCSSLPTPILHST